MRRAELNRILRSETFVRSPRLSSLLQYICERTWTGRTDELSEQQIGIFFFRRPPGFNAGEDAIVRGTARHLRKRLELYYGTEGLNSSLRLTVPKGGYVAHLEPVVEPDEPAISLPLQASPPVGTKQSVPWKLGIIAALLVLAGVVSAVLLHRSHSDASAQNDGPSALWHALFDPARRTVLVPGDPALNLYTAYTHHAVPLTAYTEQSYQTDPAVTSVSPQGPGTISKITMATMADLKLISDLVRIPYREHIPIPDQQVEVRYARDLSAADLRNANLVLLGTSSFDPWVSVYDAKLDFHLERNFGNYTFAVSDRAPHVGESAFIRDTDNQALTLVAFTSTPGGDAHVMLIQGSSMGCIYAGEHFLFTEPMWQPVIRAATIGGQLHAFEVVLASDYIRDEVSNTHVLAYHVH